jgi:tetratricopeptide (TPR) repeat protein
VRAGEVTKKFLAATTTRLKALLQGSTPASGSDHGATDFDLPVSEYLTNDGQSADPVGLEPWTLPESRLTLQERKIKKEFLQKTGPKSESMRPTKTRIGTHSKPDKVSAVEQWIRAHQLILVISGLAMVLILSAWQVGRSMVAQQLVNSGLAQLSDGLPHDALATFNHAIQVDGLSASAYFGRGNAYRNMGELKKAFDDYSMSLKLSPRKVDVLNRRATVCLKLGKYEQAANDYTVLLELASADVKPQIYANRAYSHSELGQYDKAWQDYGVALKANPKEIKALTGFAFCLMKLGRYAEAISNYDLLLKMYPHDYDSRLWRGYCYQKQRNFTLAAKDFQTVLKQSPGNKLALCYRADLYADQGSWLEAFADLASVLRLDPKFSRALMVRANVYSRKGDYANAVKDYDQAEKIPLFKEKLALCLDRAGVYEKMKEYEKAAADYTTAISLSPKNYLIYISRAKCFQQLKDYKQSIADCTTAAKLSPKTADIYQLRGTLQEQFGNPLSACKDYTNAISLNSKNIDSYVSRGHNSLAKQDFAAALADFDQALKIDPQSAAARAGRNQTVAATTAPKQEVEENVSVPPPKTNNLDLSKLTTADLIKKGYDLLQNGSAEESISLLSEAVRRNRNDPISRRYLGYALLAAKRQPEAIGQFEALRRLRALLPADQLAMQQAVRTEQSNKGAAQSKGAQQSKGSGQSAPSGDNADALISKYRAALLANPKDLDSKYNLAVTYSKAGRTEDALHECETGMNETATDAELQQKFIRLYSSLLPKQK